MQRPAEYENLIKINAFEEVAQTPGAIVVYLRNARNYIDAAAKLDATMPMPIFSMAYEGYFQLVQAVMEHYAVRTKESGRNLAIQRAATTLGASTMEFAAITKAHERRNGISYLSPFPPVSKAEADVLLSLLQKHLPAAHQLTGVPCP